VKWRVSPFVCTALLVGLGATHATAGESLGEAARREQERRNANGTAKDVRVLTNDDLATPRDRGTLSTPTADTRASEVTSAPEPNEALDREADARKAEETRWRRRFAEARRALKEAEARAWQDVIEPVLVGGGGFGGTQGGQAIFVPMRVRKFVETEELKEARRALADLEEELRRSGKPAGWGRE
jgi:hypothetical protein